ELEEVVRVRLRALREREDAERLPLRGLGRLGLGAGRGQVDRLRVVVGGGADVVAVHVNVIALVADRVAVVVIDRRGGNAAPGRERAPGGGVPGVVGAPAGEGPGAGITAPPAGAERAPVVEAAAHVAGAVDHVVVAPGVRAVAVGAVAKVAVSRAV